MRRPPLVQEEVASVIPSGFTSATLSNGPNSVLGRPNRPNGFRNNRGRPAPGAFRPGPAPRPSSLGPARPAGRPNNIPVPVAPPRPASSGFNAGRPAPRPAGRPASFGGNGNGNGGRPGFGLGSGRPGFGGPGGNGGNGGPGGNGGRPGFGGPGGNPGRPGFGGNNGNRGNGGNGGRPGFGGSGGNRSPAAGGNRFNPTRPRGPQENRGGREFSRFEGTKPPRPSNGKLPHYLVITSFYYL